MYATERASLAAWLALLPVVCGIPNLEFINNKVKYAINR